MAATGRERLARAESAEWRPELQFFRSLFTPSIVDKNRRGAITRQKSALPPGRVSPSGRAPESEMINRETGGGDCGPASHSEKLFPNSRLRPDGHFGNPLPRGYSLEVRFGRSVGMDEEFGRGSRTNMAGIIRRQKVVIGLERSPIAVRAGFLPKRRSPRAKRCPAWCDGAFRWCR